MFRGLGGSGFQMFRGFEVEDFRSQGLGLTRLRGLGLRV